MPTALQSAPPPAPATEFPTLALHEPEIAYLAYHLHWSFDTLLDLEHGDRIRLLQEVGTLNERAWQGVRGG